MKIVKQADMIMDQAQVLYEKFEDIMEPADRTVVESQMDMCVAFFSDQAAIF